MSEVKVAAVRASGAAEAKSPGAALGDPVGEEEARRHGVRVRRRLALSRTSFTTLFDSGACRGSGARGASP